MWPHLFNIFICDLFSIRNNVNFANYGDDNKAYVAGAGVIQAFESLRQASDELLYGFANNQMKANLDKCHLTTNISNKVSIYEN